VHVYNNNNHHHNDNTNICKARIRKYFLFISRSRCLIQSCLICHAIPSAETGGDEMKSVGVGEDGRSYLNADF